VSLAIFSLGASEFAQRSCKIIATYQAGESWVDGGHCRNEWGRTCRPAARFKKCQQNGKRHDLVGTVSCIVERSRQIQLL